MAAPRTRRPVVEHAGRVTKSAQLSKASLELCDWLIDNITLSAQAPDFEGEAKKISTAKREVTAALTIAGGVPIAVQRQSQAG